MVIDSFMESGENPPDFLAQIDDTTLPPLRVKNPDVIESDGEDGTGFVMESGDRVDEDAGSGDEPAESEGSDE